MPIPRRSAVYCLLSLLVCRAAVASPGAARPDDAPDQAILYGSRSASGLSLTCDSRSIAAVAGTSIGSRDLGVYATSTGLRAWKIPVSRLGSGPDPGVLIVPNGTALISWAEHIRNAPPGEDPEQYWVSMVDARTGRVKRLVRGSPACVAVSADSRRVAALFERGGACDLRFWALPSGRLLATWSAVCGRDRLVRLSPNGSRVLLRSEDGVGLCVYSFPERKVVASLANEMAGNDVWDAVFRASGQDICIFVAGRGIVEWSTRTGAVQRRRTGYAFDRGWFSIDGRFFGASVQVPYGQGPVLVLVETASGRRLWSRSLPAGSPLISCVVPSPDGRMVAVSDAWAGEPMPSWDGSLAATRLYRVGP